MMVAGEPAIPAKRLNDVFGGLRAEYFRDEIFKLFTQPTYWPEMMTRRPCLLVGGRGTGKTTALRGLSYEGQQQLVSPHLEDWNHIGVYWRIDTNVVRAFHGGSKNEDEWSRLFAHYVNLMLVQLLVDFLTWVESSGQSPIDLETRELRRCCRSLMIAESNSLHDLSIGLEDAIADFEVVINNVDALQTPSASVLGRPVAYLSRAIANDERIRGKKLFFLVDEYENLDDYQQRIFNTLIKHAGDEAYTFKVGMRSTGHRDRSTLNPDEQLVEPADYALIDIAERLKDQDFADFARSVCEGRLRTLGDDLGHIDGIDQLLPSITEEQEAEILGVAQLNEDTRVALERSGATPELISEFDGLPPLSAYMVGYWARSQGAGPGEVMQEALDDPARWRNRLNNYQHASLYTIRRGRSGIRKYYTGWSTYVMLADGNIRYLLQLVNEALQEHLNGHRSLQIPISPQLQTLAAQSVGQRLVEQIQGLSADGADLTRLVLGLGRVFQVMAANPEGHTPEVSQFRVQQVRAEPFDHFAEEILRAAVMHLAVRRFSGDKMAAASGETREFNYQLHPIFAPFFVFSPRSKRRMDIDSRDLYGLIRQPRQTIQSILARSEREDVDALPEQLELFKEYFG